LITEESKVQLVDLGSFCEALEQSFNMTEFQSLCSQIGIDYEDILGDDRAGRVRELVLYLRRRSRLAVLIVYLCEHRNHIDWAAMVEEVEESVEVSEIPDVLFVDRKFELQYIQSKLTAAYFILDAPAGFGKTTLLHQLQKQFYQDNWLSAYTAIDSNSTLSDLVKELADTLNITSLLAQDVDRRPWGMRFGTALQNHWEMLDKDGLVLLIDLDERTPHDVVKELIEQFIPDVYGCMSVLRFFARKQNRFRIVLAGRSLAPPPQTHPRIPLAIMSLRPFKLNVVEDMVRSWLPQLDDRFIQQLVAHLFYLTGGHPGSLAQTLKLFQRRGGIPDFFIQHYDDVIWREIMRPVIEEIRQDIGEKSNILAELSVLRHHNIKVLEQIVAFEQYRASYPTIVNLADELTTNYLLNRKGRFLRDDMTRRLFAIQQRRESPKYFSQQCQKAQLICAQELKSSRVREPERWMVEYLFQCLQQHTDIQNAAVRQEIRQEFFEVHVPAAIQLFVEASQGEHRLDAYQALNQQLADDWEFQFTVNYYLREQSYQDTFAFNQLQREIETYFRP
jgi:hypothetical protein